MPSSITGMAFYSAPFCPLTKGSAWRNSCVASATTGVFFPQQPDVVPLTPPRANINMLLGIAPTLRSPGISYVTVVHSLLAFPSAAPSISSVPLTCTSHLYLSPVPLTCTAPTRLRDPKHAGPLTQENCVGLSVQEAGRHTQRAGTRETGLAATPRKKGCHSNKSQVKCKEIKGKRRKE